MAPNDFNSFTQLKQFLSGKCMGSDEEVNNKFNKLMADFSDADIQKVLEASNDGV
jgi:hypothetical protein